MDAIFMLERSINGSSPAERVSARRRDIAPLVGDLIDWMKWERAKFSRLPRPGSPTCSPESPITRRPTWPRCCPEIGAVHSQSTTLPDRGSSTRALGSIHGLKFEDLDPNGLFDGNDTPMEGVKGVRNLPVCQ
jgi:hypothetical protein